MAKIPTLTRLTQEDFKDQPWISKLLYVLNSYFESSNTVLNKGVTFSDNIDSATKAVTLDGTFPVKINLAKRPIGWQRVNLQTEDGSTFTLSNAFDFVVTYTQTGVQIESVVGLTPSPTQKYVLTLIFLNG